LEELDSHRLETMNNSDRNNPRRLIRAIEITVHFKRNNKKKVNQEIEYDILKIGLRADLKFLYDRVDIRIHQRIREGAIEEVKNIKDKKASLYSATGIASLSDFIGGKIGLNEAIQKWKMEEHAYIKRQLTWFRKETDIEWFDREEKGYEEKIETVVRTWYTER
jgi:tRNA dimethylallyltransferase